jgi:hypothetical protein
MKIVILGWGSLVWDPRQLPIKNKWHLNGPKLPIEFSRISTDARLTLVIDEKNGVNVPTRFAESKRSVLADAAEDLKKREGTKICNIGFTDRDECSASFLKNNSHRIAQIRIIPWLSLSNFDAVVWTHLTSNYELKTKRKFTIVDAANYLISIPSNCRKKALEYIEKAPSEVETPLRKYLSDHNII